MGAARATDRRRLPAAQLLLVSAMALAACNNPIGGGAPADARRRAPTVAEPRPRLRAGVITYATYQVAMARDGDTLDDVAARVGTTTEALAARNALPADYRLREGEVLLLPDGVARPAGRPAASRGDTVTSQPLGGPGSTAAAGDAPARQSRSSNGQTEPLIDPVRHRVEAGETAYSIARLYGVSVTALASWNGLGPDLAVRENQELLIPHRRRRQPHLDRARRTPSPGQGTPVPAPPSAAAPLPADITAAVDAGVAEPRGARGRRRAGG